MVNSRYGKRQAAFDLADDCICWQGPCVVNLPFFEQIGN